jgi:UDP-glucose 4-epimerase
MEGIVNILVTGGAGFIGSHVAEELVSQGHNVIILDDFSGGFMSNVVGQVKLIRGSITDTSLVESIFDKFNIDYIFHLAAYAAEGLSHFIRKFNYENNLIGSINLINAAVNHQAKCFVFTSSIAVYGKNQLPMREDLTPVPEDPYGIAKLAVEQDLKSAHKMFKLPYIIFRPHNVYGERQNIGDRYRNVIGIFMNQIMQGKPMTVFGDGTQTRAFSYIKDVAPIIANSINYPTAYNQIFNIGADKPYSINELAISVAKAMGVEEKIIYLEARNEVEHAYASHEKVHQIFGVTEYTELNVGLRKMAHWVKKVESRTYAKFSNIEIAKNMPKSWLQAE